MQETNFVTLTRLVIKKWKVISIWCLCITLVGVLVVFTTPHVYKSTALLAPEQVADNDIEDAIYPEIYPNIVNSTDFLLQLFDVEIKTADGKVKTTYKDYLTSYTKRSLISYPIGWVMALRQKMAGNPVTISNDTLEDFQQSVTLSKADEELLMGLRGAISCKWDKKTGVITLDVVDQDPLVAAIIANHVTNQLQAEITEYRTRKARLDMEYAQQVYDDANTAYLQAQAEYATYTDAYSHATLESYKIQQESLKQTVDLHFKTFSDAKIKLQETKMKLQENTPAFYIFQQASIAGKPFGASRAKKMLMWLCCGLIAGIGMVILKERFKR